MYFQIFLPAQGYVYWLNLSRRSGQGMLDQGQKLDWYFGAKHGSWVVTNLKYPSGYLKHTHNQMDLLL